MTSCGSWPSAPSGALTGSSGGTDEYIIAAQGVLPYCATPEELVCQQETLDEILAVLTLCTHTQQERFLLYALYDYSYAEIGQMCGCSKAAVHDSIESVRKKFFKFFR